jgi:ABC-type polysaccharide/polyol phosphate export permease
MGDICYTDADQRRIWRVVPDLIRARELLLDLTRKDLRAKYRYTLMGFAWAVLEPLALMLILSFVFTFVFVDKTAILSGGEGRPFAVTLLCGLVPWQFLAHTLATGTRSLVVYQNLVNKVHFPREIVPLSTVITALVNLAIGLIELLVVHLILGGSLGFGILWFPVALAIQVVLVSGLVLLLSCAFVFFRDIDPMVYIAVVFGFYATPIFYPLQLVMNLRAAHPWLVNLYLLNPMAELVTAYRQILFENRFPDPVLLIWPCVAAVACLLTGIVVFRRNSPVFADYL